jgi:hypothetical protein
MLMHMGIATALGQEPKLDPTKADFLTVDVAGERIGFGSIWTSLARTTGDIFEQVEKNPGEMITLDPQKSILARAIRYRGSPFVGLGWDTIVGKDAIGRPLDTYPKKIRRGFEGIMPFWSQGFLPDSDPDTPEMTLDALRSKAISAGAEFLGARAFPTSVFQRRELRRQSLALSLPMPRPWDELSGFEQQYIEKNDSELKELDILVKRWGVERGDDVARLTTEYLGYSDDFKADYSADLNEAETVLKDKPGSGADFRDRVREAGAILRARYEAREDDPRYDAARLQLTEWRELNKTEGTNDPIVEDLLYQEYLEELVLASDLQDAYGDYRHEEAEKRKESLRKRYGDDAWRRLQVRLEYSTDTPPSVDELRKGQDIFGTYWTIGDDIAEEMGILEVWKQYKEIPPQSPEALAMKDDPRIGIQLKVIEKNVRDTRKALRAQSPALDAWLYKFGYTTSFENKATEKIGKGAVQAWDFDTMSLPMNM